MISISVTKCPLALLHLCLGIQTINGTNCPPNAVPQVKENDCIYLNLKISLTFTLTSLMEISSKCLELTGHFVLDVKIGGAFLNKSVFPMVQQIDGFHLTSRRLCWCTGNAVKCLGNLTLFLYKTCGAIFYCFVHQYGLLVTWMQTKNGN